MWSRWPPEVPFNLSYCVIMRINGFLVWVWHREGGLAARSYGSYRKFRCKLSFSALAELLAPNSAAVWLRAAEH